MISSSLLTFLTNNSHQLANKLSEHIYLVFVAVSISILIGVPLGIFITYQKKTRNTVLGITNIFQTIPSLALLAFLIPFLGIGTKPTIVALTVYALLPIVRNTYIGLNNIPPETLEAANGLGFTQWQRIRMIELPLAMPTIVSGIRIATAMTIGITTIAAFIGAGGLGDFITEGLALNDTRLILLGSIPAAILALVIDFFIGKVEKLLSYQKKASIRHKYKKIVTHLLLPCFVIFLTIGLTLFSNFSHKNRIIIATKNFSEQFILGNMMADLLKAKTDLRVIKKFNLGSTAILHNALINREVDLYPEYTGTAYLIVLNHKKLLPPDETYQIVKDEYYQRFQLIWLHPFGFNNSQTLAIKKDFSKTHHIKNLSQLSKISNKLNIAAPIEFLKRPDALPGLTKVYGFKFKKIYQVQPDLVYSSTKSDDIDVIEVFTTDGRISEYGLNILKDDKHFYKPYYAAPVIRASVLKLHPEIKRALAPLSNLIDKKTMQHLNYLVDVKHLSPQKVAHDFLIKKGLISY